MSAMELGFTTENLRTMNFSRLLFFIRVKADQYEKASKKKEQPREATQADINSMFCM